MEFIIKEDNRDIRNIILTTKVPLIIKNQVECELITWDLEKWNQELGAEQLQFRCGKNEFTEEPQWESKCKIQIATFDEFLRRIESKEDKEWWYFDYKYLCQWFTEKEGITEKIDWSTLGFPEMKSNESTIWIGSKWAHTPCHMDTYGCNMILQVFGRKRWLLFPPEENLKPTRIPFEESSIYSKLNFFSPNLDDFKGINHCHEVILNPGDVLVVPNKWWHYVENLETSISINAWLTLPSDDFQRIKESVATILVGNLVHNNDRLGRVFLNPNMTKELLSRDDALTVMKSCKDKCRGMDKARKITRTDLKLTADDDVSVIDCLMNKHKNITKVPVSSQSETKALLKIQSERFVKSKENLEPKGTESYKELIEFFNVVMDEEVLELIARKYVENQ